MKIIGYHIAQNLIANSDMEVCTKKPWLDFLFADKGKSIKVFYHMDYSVACLLKIIGLSEEACKELLETTDLEYKGYSFQYIPRKWFAVKDLSTKQWAGFSDMTQYTTTNLEPTDDHIADALDFAAQAQITGVQVYNILVKLGLHPKSLTSPISAFNKEVLSKIDLPTIEDLPDEVAKYAYECCKGSWIETFQLGHFSDTLDFDICSAYGSELAKLIDFRYGKWISDDDYVKIMYKLPKPIYGYCKGTVTITKPFSPILYKSNSQTYTPTGSWETYLTKNEIDFINKWNLGIFKIEDGWWWIPEYSPFRNSPYESVEYEAQNILHPFTKTIHKLYTQKQQASSDFEANIVKRIMSGIWGKLGEYTEKGFGELFNPVWCAEVETNIRLKVAEFVLANNLQEHLLSVVVDGVLMKNIDQPYSLLLSKATEGFDRLSVATNSRTMGSWKLSTHCPAFVLGSGLQAVKDKHSSAVFSLQYDKLLDYINSNPKAKEYSITGLSPVTLAKAIKEDRLEDLGNLEEIKRTIDFGEESKRCYKAQPHNSKELHSKQYTSVPWDISIVQEEPKIEDESAIGNFE